MSIKIKTFKEVPKNATLLEGFQGVGVVGTLSAQYISSQKDAEQIGYISSEELPPLAVLSGGKIRHPIRIFKFEHEGKPFLVIESELPIPSDLTFKLAKEITKWARENEVDHIISLEGALSKDIGDNPKVYAITNKEELKKEFKDYAEMMESGLVVGVSAAILLESEPSELKSSCLLAEAHSKYPDGRAAAAVVEALNDKFNFGVDTKELVEQSKKFENQIMDVMKKAKKAKKSSGEVNKTYIG